MATRLIPGSGAEFTPVFNDTYGVISFTINNGGSGYASTDPPKIEVSNTISPLREGSFYPIIAGGSITQISVLDSGEGYFPTTSSSDTRIGIKTSSFVETSKIVTKFDSNNNGYLSVASTESSIIMDVLGAEGTSIYENGYNVAISTNVTGVSAPVTPNFSFNQNRFYGFFDPFPSYYTSGLGTGSTYNAFIVYNSTTGDAISTSLVLRKGGNRYSKGDTVSISGTHFGGSTPANDLSFNVSNLANTRIGSEANQIYVGLAGSTLSGVGTGAIFTVSRDFQGDIDDISVDFGGVGYALTDSISIPGDLVGGVTPGDDVKLSPAILGRDDLPEELYVQKVSDNGFRVTGLSTTEQLEITTYGIGTHSFTFDNPNSSGIILIDNIIQSPLYKRDLLKNLILPVGINTEVIYLSGISSLTSLDVIQIDSEFFKIKDVGLTSATSVEVVRGILGSEVGYHTVGAAVTIIRGDFNIVKDEIHFNTAPYGPVGPEGLKVNSSFTGRMFSRQIDPANENDKNIIFDDISTKFVGASSTEFFLENYGERVVGVYTDTNTVLTGGIDINNNPLVLINNVPQISETDFEVDKDDLQPDKGNRLKFLTGTPGAGKISATMITPGLGYQPLISAGATAIISAAGTISNVVIGGYGSGYKFAPSIEIYSNIGSGSSLSASINSLGVVTSVTIVNPGSGYTQTSPPILVFEEPTNYNDLDLEFVPGISTGNGSGAKASVVIGQKGDVIQFEMEQPGLYYKSGDVLYVPGLIANSGITTISVTNLVYDHITGISTITTASDHGFAPDDYIKLSGVIMDCDSWAGIGTYSIIDFQYDKESGITTITTDVDHYIPVGDYVKLRDIELSCNNLHSGITSTIFPYPAGTNTYGDAYPQSSQNTLQGTYDVFRTIGGTSANKIVFDAGISTITHSYTPGAFLQQIVPTDANYDTATGEFTIVSVAHTVTTGQRVKLETEGFVFTCTMDGNATEHSLPESDQYAAGRHLPVVGVTTDSFTVNVGAAGAGDFYTPTESSYNTNTGDITLTLGNHNVSIGDTIFIQDNALTFTCDMDSNQAQKTYPRPNIDPYANKGIEVTGVAGTTITVNVGTAGTDRYYTPSDADYNPVTGDLTVTVGQHGLGVGRNVVLADNSFTFTCALDNHQTQHNYPRPGVDPYAGKSIAITNVGLTTHTVTNAVYNTTLGIVSFTVPNHGFSNSDYVKVDDNSLLFTCDLDGNTAIKAYPRPNYDFPSGRWMIISNSTTDTFEINVGLSTYAGNHTFVSAEPYGLERQDGTFTINVGTGGTDTSEHTFVSASLNAIEYTPQSTHTFISALTNSIARNPTRYFTPSDATYNPISGDVVLTIGEHPFTKGEGIVLRPNSLSFTCDMDNNQSVKSYPRPGIDPYAARSIPVKDYTPTTITLNVGVSGPNKYYTPTDANYNPSTGNLTVTVGQHGLGVGRNVVLDDNSFTFTCDLDGNSTQHTYPRPGIDPYAGRSIKITSVGVTTHTATDAPYNAVTGVVTLEVAGHGFSNGDYVLIEDNSLRYSCDLDGHSQWKYYPRPNYDYPSGRWLPISGVTTDTFNINVGESSYTGIHTFISATADGIKRQDGTFTMYVGTGGTDTSNHTFISATTNAIKHEPQSNHTFIAGIPYSVRQDIQAPHTFVRTTPNAVSIYEGNGSAIVGITTNVFPYPGGSYNTIEGTYDIFKSLQGTSGNTIVLNTGISTIAHTYDYGGDITKYAPKRFTITVDKTLTDKFSGFYPGQFIQFDDVSRFFNGFKRKFTLTVTEGSITEVLSLKTKKESDLRMENNIFVFINDVLQEPVYSYTWNGSRIIFKEAPIPNSKCTILFYRGSDLDVMQIDPPKTIKIGDDVKIGENRLDPVDRPQFERIVKRIVSSDALDTFSYDSLGINTDTTKQRPLDWTKQTQDKIINGVLYSKSRPNLLSSAVPITKLISNLNKSDREIYVNNAFPLFSEIDNLPENISNVKIIDKGIIEPAFVDANVSTNGNIDSLTLTDGGQGFRNITNPNIIISSSAILRRDPIYNWVGTAITGISTSNTLNSLTIGEPIVAVGQSSIIGISTNGMDWSESVIGYGGTINFNSVAVGGTDRFVAVGENAKALFATGNNDSISSWNEFRLFREVIVFGQTVPQIKLSTYDDTFNAALYSEQINSWVVVGENRGLFVGAGIGATTLLEKNPSSFGGLKAIAFNNIFTIAVGDDASILYTNDGIVWQRVLSIPSTKTLHDIIWDGNKFIVVGDQGTILYSTSGSVNWLKFPASISVDLIKIRYEYGVYILLDAAGVLYYSLDLINWVQRDTKTGSNQPKDLQFIPAPPPPGVPGYISPIETSLGRFVLVGSGGTTVYAEPVYNRATGVATVTNGSVSSVSLVNTGFGYTAQNTPAVLVESDRGKSEDLFSIKAKGDFGYITNIGVGVSHIDFVLESETYDNSSLGIGYSSLNAFGVNYSEIQVGDYFVITESNSIAGHALTGITTYLGGLNNYPDSKVGTAVSYIDGVYRAEKVFGPVSGIVTVRCMFTYSATNGPIQVNTFNNTNGIYGRYSWGKIYDYQNRLRFGPEDFIVNTDNGLVGLSTAPEIYRTRAVK